MCARGAAISGYARGSRCGGARDIHLIDGTLGHLGSSGINWRCRDINVMAGAMKKAGHAVESFKPEGGERTYRIK